MSRSTRGLLFVGVLVVLGCGGGSDKNGSGSSPVDPKAPPPKGAGPREVDEPIILATKNTASVGELKVTLAQLDTGFTGRHLRAEFVVYTQDPKKHFEFQSWSTKRSELPPARDDLGNSYPSDRAASGEDDSDRFNSFGDDWFVARGFMKAPQQGWGGGGVTAELAQRDVLYYQLSAPKAGQLTIDLPAKNIGKPGVIRFVLAPPK